MNNAQIKAAATRRLMRDLREWKSCQHLAKSITAAPLERNIFEWHVNFFPEDGKLKGIIFHLSIIFKYDYPESYPKVRVKNELIHPNVFNNYICLDMLKVHGWCRAYSVTSILFQLLSFLVTKRAPQDYGGSILVRYNNHEIESMKQHSMNYKCYECNHSFSKPFPPLNAELWYNIKPKTLTNDGKIIPNAYDMDGMENYWDKTMHTDVERLVIEFLDINDIISFGRVNKRFKKLIKDYAKYVKMARFNCWYHRIDLRYSEHLRTLKFSKDGIAKSVILGYGITPEFYSNTIIKRTNTNNNSGTNKRKIIIKDKDDKQKANQSLIIPYFPILKACDTVFDLLSYDAFKNHGIKCTPTNTKNFTHFIPMYILHNRYHGRQSLHLLKSCTLNVYKKTTKYHPMMSVQLITSIMSSLVVTLMESIKSKAIHHSINVMETYYHYFHLLLAVYFTNYDILHPIIQEKCIGFVRDINKRNKKNVANLGYFMIWFLLFEFEGHNITSKSIFKALLQELLVRSVKWLIKKYGYSYESQTLHNFDIKRAFKGSFIGLRLFMFQYFFIVKCCDVGIISPKEKFNELNKNLGCVSEEITKKLQKFCQRTLSGVDNWEIFFGEIDIRYPTKFGMQCWLRRSVYISAERRYHYYTFENLNANTDLIVLCERLLFEAAYKNDIDAVKMLLNVDQNDDDGYNTDDEGEEDMNKDDDDDDDEKKKKEDEDYMGDLTDYRYKIVKSTISQYLTTKKEHNQYWDISRLIDKKMVNKKGNTPLFVAVQNSNQEMVELLLKYKFDTQQVMTICDKLLFEAIKRNDIKTIKWILRINEEEDEEEVEDIETESDDYDDYEEEEEEQKINGQEQEYQSKLQIMKVFNKLSNFSYIPHRSCINPKGQSLIHIAAQKCYPEIVKLLIEQDFDVNIVDFEGKTALRYAQNGRTQENKKKMNYIIKLIKKQKKKQKNPTYDTVQIEIEEDKDVEPYKYNGTGFEILWKENGEKPIYAKTTLYCSKTFGGNKDKIKDLLLNKGYFEKHTIKNIRIITENNNNDNDKKEDKKEDINRNKNRNRNRNRNRKRNINKNNITDNNMNKENRKNENNQSKTSKANRRKQRRKVKNKINRYSLIDINDKMDEIYDSIYRINTAEKREIIKIYNDDKIENKKENPENCRLYIQNFDIIDGKCHLLLTNLLLRYGQLTQDIIIGIDKSGNPFCLAHYKNKNDAIGIKQSRRLIFGKRILNIKYSTQNK